MLDNEMLRVPGCTNNGHSFKWTANTLTEDFDILVEEPPPNSLCDCGKYTYKEWQELARRNQDEGSAT